MFEYRADKIQFKCTQILNDSSSQIECFEALKGSLIHSVLKGRSITSLFYGQTGAGKTYTMFGLKDGIVFRTVNELFQFNSQDAKGYKLEFTFSSFQLYNQTIFDLSDKKVTFLIKSQFRSFF